MSELPPGEALDDGRHLLISCQDDDSLGGGLFAYDGRGMREIDRVSSAGLFYRAGRLVRALWSGEADNDSELLIYDQGGVLHYHRLAGISDVHDVRWFRGDLVVVATDQNAVMWLSAAGDVVRRWSAPGEPDSWHLNSLAERDGRLHVCAFGRFPRSKGWVDNGRPRSGRLIDIESRRDVLTGLHAPHSARFVDGAWLLCNSASKELLEIDVADVPRRRRTLGGFTRGLAVGTNALFIGVNPYRGGGAGRSAHIVVLDRASWSPLGRIEVPAAHVYDVILVPGSMTQGAARGFSSNARREREQAQLSMFRNIGSRPARIWALGDPLAPEDCRVAITPMFAEMRKAVGGSLMTLRYLVRNLGSAILTYAPPHPVKLACRWLTTDGLPAGGEAGSAPLTRSLPPREDIKMTVRIRAPAMPGEYRLKVTLMQEDVIWFDDVDPANAAEHLVEVVHADAVQPHREDDR